MILCDHALRGFTSFDALELLKQRQYDVPFIILSGMIGEEVAVQAMKAGANDYVLKGAVGRLVPSVEREVREAANRRAGRQAEKALRRSQYDLTDFFENAPFGLHWAGPEGMILRVNAAELRMLGYGPPEYLGHNLLEFFVDYDAGKGLLQQLRQGKAIEDYETQLRGKDETVKEVAITPTRSGTTASSSVQGGLCGTSRTGRGRAVILDPGPFTGAGQRQDTARLVANLRHLQENPRRPRLLE